MASQVNYGRLALMVGLPVVIGIASATGLHSVPYGILIGIAAMIVIGMIVAKRNPAPAWTRPGTRAWEAKLTNDVLMKVVGQRLEMMKTAPAADLPKLQREISFLSKQADANLAIIDANVSSPGRGYVGFDPYTGD